MERDEAFEFLGINKFRELGYTGSRVKIMSDEKIEKQYPNTDKERWQKVICPKGYQTNGSWHGSSIMRILQDICPDATYISFPMDMKTVNGKYSSKCVDYILENKVHLFTTSQVGGSCSSAKEQAMTDCINNGTTFFCAAGNKGTKGMLGEAKSDKHIAIGALEPNKKLKWASYSSVGKELDYVSIGFYGTGTSFTTPTVCAMCGLVQDFFIDKTGRALNRDELIDFIDDHLIDVEAEGFDTKTGNGLFVLPDPREIDIKKYCKDYIEKEEVKEEPKQPEIKEETKVDNTMNNTTIKMYINKKQILCTFSKSESGSASGFADSDDSENSKIITTDVAPYIKDGRTMVPLRIIAEILGCNVEWDGTKQEITITK